MVDQDRRRTFALALLPLVASTRGMSDDAPPNPRPYGRLADGQTVDLYTIGTPDGLQAELLTLGGTLRSLTLPVKGRRIPLVLSLPDLPAYLADTSYLGQLVGRYCNRIGGAAFELDGKKYALTANNGPNTLHGGTTGFGKFVWKVVSHSPNELVLSHLSPADLNGFPGNLEVVARIVVTANTLALHYTAKTDTPTPISLTWHPYFNISGDPARPIEEQRMRIAAAHYLPVNDARVPTGEVAPVDGTPFDFRKGRTLAVPPPSTNAQLALTGGWDHCWALDKGARVAAELFSPASGVRMRVRTDMPGLQVYGAYHLRTAYPGLHGVCMEPENFPDAPNHPNFPNSILRPGEKYQAFMSFEFGA